MFNYFAPRYANKYDESMIEGIFSYVKSMFCECFPVLAMIGPYTKKVQDIYPESAWPLGMIRKSSRNPYQYDFKGYEVIYTMLFNEGAIIVNDPKMSSDKFMSILIDARHSLSDEYTGNYEEAFFEGCLEALCRPDVYESLVDKILQSITEILEFGKYDSFRKLIDMTHKYISCQRIIPLLLERILTESNSKIDGEAKVLLIDSVRKFMPELEEDMTL